MTDFPIFALIIYIFILALLLLPELISRVHRYIKQLRSISGRRVDASHKSLDNTILRQSDETIVILVHGTFAQNTEWIQPGSNFRATIEEKLGRSAKIYNFVWSGENTLKGRELASRRLATYLEVIQKNNRQLPTFLIGHSHGGDLPPENRST